jgi:NADPH:quinone reductase-like Zn-dependent oxidoreductase
LKAVIYTGYGGPEVLQLVKVEPPSPGDNEVLVKVFAVSVNDWDWSLMNSKTFADRLMAQLSKPKHRILGSDIAGRVVSVGKNITKFTAGDAVFGDLSGAWGGFAEYVCAKEHQLGFKPPSMSFEQAASIPQAGMLAVQGLIDKGKLAKGEKLLINGAGGGVGTFGLQIAKSMGAEVTVVDSREKLGMLQELGADHVVDYKTQDFTLLGKKHNLILDTKTNRSPFRYLRALTNTGRYVTVGGSLSRLLQCLLAGPFISLFSKKKVRIVALKPNKDLDYMSRLFNEGTILPVIDGRYTLEEVPQAFSLFAEARHKGKVVITVANPEQPT